MKADPVIFNFVIRMHDGNFSFDALILTENYRAVDVNFAYCCQCLFVTETSLA